MTDWAFQIAALRVQVDASLVQGAVGELLLGFPGATAGPAALRIVPGRPGSGADPADAVPSFFQGSLQAWSSRDGFILQDEGVTVVVSDGGRRLEVVGPTSGGRAGERAFLVGMVLALRYHGLFHLHAAALRAPGGAGVLVAGSSGAGKTTLALALAGAGLASLADDAVLAYRGDGGAPSVVGIPRPFHLALRTAAAFPALAPRLGPPAPGGKRPLSLVALGGRAGAGPGTCAPDLLLLPQVVEEESTTATPAPPAAALGALLESGALLVADGVPRVHEQLAVLRALADGARAIRVRMGRDLLRAPAATARALLDALAA